MKRIRIWILSILPFLIIAELLSIGPFNPGGTPGTIVDGATGLTWTQCSMGQSTTAPCSGAVTAVNWTAALNYCNTLALGGFVWRLPNIKELYTIVNYNVEGPAISGGSFPNTPSASNSYYWTSTTHPSPSGTGGRHRAMMIDFREGGSDDDVKTGLHYVRCVKGP
ncbi:DUF1566 domain-containing protein [Leptospira yasudae]|uniref:Lcl C-terminal domain-containing protein n=1 Tax=Leptospira yasudae TaxID=2202201 RepID=UPI000E59D825|nr:DUF1566 domain-containing protein [Leptospira yasudae]RHX94425.1 DUF1566 domain-containing protein [Leptospira yasudae]TGK24182.1 DUF1566 domain-containing protein [Leptospira yasudae]TGM00794.1 DUF1566 domain-containing protein [Leptospira yasudae]